MKTLKRRRREHKTDYGKRLKLLKSGKPRLVFRRTNKYIIAQYVESKEAKDTVKLTLTSKALLNYGWPKQTESGLKSLPASYLLGYLVGKKITSNNLKVPILDFGMLRVIHKGKPYAFIKGLTDSGISIECDPECFPDEARIKGSNLKNKIPFDEIKSKIDQEK